MNKKIFLLAAIFIGFYATAAVYGATLKKIAKETEASCGKKGVLSVAVLSFNYKGGRVNSGTELVRRELIKHYDTMEKFTVIDKELCDMVIVRFMLNDSSTIGRKTAVEIGKLLDADILVEGQLKDVRRGKTLVRAVVINAHRAEVLTKVKVKIGKVWSDAPARPAGDGIDYTACPLPLDFIEILVDYDEVNKPQPMELVMKPGDSISLIAAPNINGSSKKDINKMIIGFSPTWSAPYGNFVPYNSGTKIKYIYSGKHPVEFYIKAKQINNRGKIIEGRIKVVVPEKK